MSLVDKIYDLTDDLPDRERFGLAQQLRRAAVSVAANIAEGHARTTRGEFKNQLSVARGESAEVETLLLVVERRQYVNVETLRSAQDDCDAIMRMITKMKRGL